MEASLLPRHDVWGPRDVKRCPLVMQQTSCNPKFKGWSQLRSLVLSTVPNWDRSNITIVVCLDVCRYSQLFSFQCVDINILVSLVCRSATSQKCIISLVLTRAKWKFPHGKDFSLKALLKWPLFSPSVSDNDGLFYIPAYFQMSVNGKPVVSFLFSSILSGG